MRLPAGEQSDRSVKMDFSRSKGNKVLVIFLKNRKPSTFHSSIQVSSCLHRNAFTLCMLSNAFYIMLKGAQVAFPVLNRRSGPDPGLKKGGSCDS